MYYSDVEIEYTATSFSPARTDLALKLLSNILIWTSTGGSVRYKRKIQNRKIQSKRVLGLMKYTHRLSDHNGLREGYGVKECLWEWTVIFLSACSEGILQLFTDLYLQRKFLIFLRHDCDCKVVDLYKRLPQYWPYGGIQRISWPANRTRFVTKWLKRGRVHNLDLLKNKL